jgi:hypothetical protein
MAEQMLFRRGQKLSRAVAWPSFAGRGLVERMRTTAFALLGLTTAMALGLVAFVSHQSWPYLPVGPVPSYQERQGHLDSAIALAPAAAELGLAADVAAPGPASSGGSTAPASNGSRRSGSQGVEPQTDVPEPAPDQPGVEAAPAPSPATAPSLPAQPPAPAPAAAPVSTTPATPVGTPTSSPTPKPPSPPPSPSPTPSPPRAVTGNPGKGHAYGRQKAVTAPNPSAPAPVVSVPTVEPSPAPTAEPSVAATDLSAGPGNGHGHAYGHDK